MAGKRLYTLNEEIFNQINSQEKAYWFGFLCADGSIHKSCTNQYVIQCKLSLNDINHLEKMKLFFETNKPLYINTKNNKSSYNKNSKSVNFSLSSKQIYLDLEKYGCTPNKSLTLQFPKLKDELIPHFIRGYFDGDGSVFPVKTKSKFRKLNLGINFIGTLDITQNILNIINNILGSNIKVQIEKRTINPVYYFSTNFSYEKGLLIYNYLYKDATIYLDRKKLKFEEILQQQLTNIQDVQRL